MWAPSHFFLSEWPYFPIFWKSVPHKTLLKYLNSIVPHNWVHIQNKNQIIKRYVNELNLQIFDCFYWLNILKDMIMFSCSLLCRKVWFVLKQGHVQFHSISMCCQCLIINLLLNNTYKWIINLLLINFHNVCYFLGGGLGLGVELIFCLTCGFYSNNLYEIGGGFHHLTAMLWTKTKSMFSRKKIFNNLQ